MSWTEGRIELHGLAGDDSALPSALRFALLGTRPSGRFALVDPVHQLLLADAGAAEVHGRLTHPEWLALAALILSAPGDGKPAVATARQLAKQLDLGTEADQEIALLVGESGLLRAAAARTGAFGETVVIPIALHLERKERARALYLLTIALEELSPDGRRRLDDLASEVLAALAHPELTGRPARNIVERRRSEAVRRAGPGTPAAHRANTAPIGYLLNQDSASLARHAEFLDPLPARRRANVAIAPLNDRPNGDQSRWRVEVAARDQPGFLAATTGVLHDAGLEVAAAAIATWPDGGALQSFSVGAIERPDAAALAEAVSSAMGAPVPWSAVTDAQLTFDDNASPWYTLCEVRAADRPGLLHSLAGAFAAAGAEVHVANVSTAEGLATDRFELTDRKGHKIEPAIQGAVRQALTGGGPTARRRLFTSARTSI